jgi:hypothetical protein
MNKRNDNVVPPDSTSGVETPNDPKLSDCGVRRGTCMADGKAAAEAGAVTHGAVRCSAWFGDVGLGVIER